MLQYSQSFDIVESESSNTFVGSVATQYYSTNLQHFMSLSIPLWGLLAKVEFHGVLRKDQQN